MCERLYVKILLLVGKAINWLPKYTEGISLSSLTKYWLRMKVDCENADNLLEATWAEPGAYLVGVKSV